MIRGSVVGLVLDNRDPDGMHRVLVQYPVASQVHSSWCRMVSPMAGVERGLVMLPDVGTEVLLAFAYQSMSPYVLGALYNGEDDLPEPYRNDDGQDDRRVFWSRSGHLLDFDDTPGAERVGIGVRAPTRLEVRSAPVWQDFEDADKRISTYSEGSIFVDAGRSFTVKCGSASIQADQVLIGGGQQVVLAAKRVELKAGSVARASSPDTLVKTPSVAPQPQAAPTAAPARHPPSTAGEAGSEEAA